MNKDKNPLYRTINTRTHHVHDHNNGEDAKYARNTKKGIPKSMKKNVKRGLDFTPLFKFLLSKVGQPLDKVYSEAITRIPPEEKKQIDYLFDKTRSYVRLGESTYFSTLMVDENGLIQKTDPSFNVENLYPSCQCCTHTFNGHVLANKYENNPAFKTDENL